MKKSVFGKLLLSGCVLLAGCNGLSESGQRTKGNEFLGTWERTNTKCPQCERWEFSRTGEGNIMGEKFNTASLEFPHQSTKYPASYQSEDGRLIVHMQMGVTAGIDNGELNISGKTYRRLGQ